MVAIKEKIDEFFKVKKLVILRYLLKSEGTLHQYVRLQKDKEGKFFLTYAFDDGEPDNNYDLPRWAKELKVNRIYKISGWSGSYWYIDNTKNVTQSDLFRRKKFRLSLIDIKNILLKLI